MMYFIYDEEYLDEDGDFDYIMSPCFDNFEQAANHGVIIAQRENKNIVTLITDEGMIITFWNPMLDQHILHGNPNGKVSLKKYLPKWAKNYKKKVRKKGEIDTPDIPDICPEFDVD